MRLLPPALLLLAAALLAQQPARDAARPRTGTASISGIVVTDESNSRPVRGATVMLVCNGDPGNQWTASTDDAGRFAFAGLPPGNSTLVAKKPAYVTTYYGSKRPGTTIGVPIALTDGQSVTNLSLRLPRGAVVTGTIYDEAGRPMQGAPVRLGQVTVSSTGARSIAPVSGVVVPSTDDRGVYRVFGLPPGDYVVSVQPRMTGTGDLRQPTAAELQWAEQQVRAATAASVSPAAQTPPPGAPMTYANVFYPGTADASAAAAVTVASGQERAGIDIHALFVATARLEGTIVDPNGQPASGVQISLLAQTSPALSGSAVQDLQRQLALMEVGLLTGTSARSNAAGSFVVSGVAPGRYSLMASTAPRLAPGGGRGESSPAAPALWATTDVEVDGHDISGIALTLAPGMSVSGRFAFDGKTPPPDQARVTVGVSAVAGGASAVGTVTVAGANPVFSVTGLAPGTYRLGATLPSWTLKSAMLNGRDVSDAVFEIRPREDVADIVVTFTDAPAAVSGVLYDSANRPSADLSIILFPTDRALWYRGSRRVSAPVRPSSDGRFSFTGLPAGEYFLAALADVTPNEAADPQFLEQVVPAAIKIALAQGEKKTQDIKIAR